MEIKEIEYSSHFKRIYQKLDSRVQHKAEKQEIIFRHSPFDPHLKTHKLKGKLKAFYSFSIDYKIRIVFRFIGRHKAVFLDIGDHAIYQ